MTYTLTRKSQIKPFPPDRNKSSEILYGVSKTVGRGLYFMSNVTEKMDICFDKNGPSLTVEMDEYRNGYLEIRKRGGKIRALTEITKENAHDCRKLIDLVDELRHLDGVKGRITVSESEYLATTVSSEKNTPIQAFYSKVKEVVEQGHYLFDTLWNTSVPAIEKLRELEEGNAVEPRTRIIEGAEEIIKVLRRMTAESEVLSVCLTSGGLLYAYTHFFEAKKKLVELRKKGQHKGVRYVTNINNRETASLAEVMINAGMNIRHIGILPPMSFGVSQKEIAATFESMKKGNNVQKLIVSDDPSYLKHFAAIFEAIWKDSVDAEQRIIEIKKGIEIADIEIIRNPTEAVGRIHNILTDARCEILGIFPTINAFRRQLRMGIADLINQLVVDRGIHMKILISSSVEQFNDILENDPVAGKLLDTMKVSDWPNEFGSSSYHSYHSRINSKRLEIKCLDIGSETALGIVVIDRSKSFIIETRDDTQDSSYEAAGLAAYSNSKHMALSYVTIFEFLWKQIELYDKMRIHDRMQNEFINTAAHELRTPIQPILSLSQILHNRHGAIDGPTGLLEVILRNAYRLKNLTEDILDASRIEGKSLNLYLDHFDLAQLVESVVNEFSNEYNGERVNHTCKISFISRYRNAAAYCDRKRIEQVLRNLLSNALNFASHGSISVSLFRHISTKEWIVSVKDAGKGIDSEIFPRLFTKFITKSEHGIGLGLYISKNIIEAHQGRIWAENNKNGRGATFSFSLPMAKKA